MLIYPLVNILWILWKIIILKEKLTILMGILTGVDDLLSRAMAAMASTRASCPGLQLLELESLGAGLWAGEVTSLDLFNWGMVEKARGTGKKTVEVSDSSIFCSFFQFL